MGAHVFISYSRGDGAFVRDLLTTLHEGGVEVWFDEDTQMGERFTPVLKVMIETCAAFLLVMSPRSEHSEWVEREVTHAQKSKRRLCPVLLEGEPFFSVTHIQYEVVLNGKIPDRLVERLRALAPLATDPVIGQLGSSGSAALTNAVAGLDVGPIPVSVDASVLAGISARLARTEPSPKVSRAAMVVADLGFAMSTGTFVHDHLPATIDNAYLRPALATALGQGVPAGLHTETDYFEHVALAYPAEHGDCRPSMTRFVVALASRAGYDPQYPALRDWIRANQTTRWANEILTDETSRESSRRVRLVVSLGSFAGHWPNLMRAWLLDGKRYLGKKDFPLGGESEDLDDAAAQLAAETALREAVVWGQGRAYDETRHILERLEIALPARIALSWRPERVLVGPMLSADFSVVVRWSERIDPRQEWHWINYHAVKCLRHMEASLRQRGEPLVAWLRSEDVADDAKLRASLQTRRDLGAIGLAGPGLAEADLADLLLRFSPILLWPDHAEEVSDECQVAVSQHWESLPEAFATAYHEEVANGGGGPLAALRAFWDDREWIEFCLDQRVGR